MKSNTNAHSSALENMEDEQGLRRGPWSVEEDLLLMNYINQHGEGQWNSLARCAGLKRTGKSCRLRWLNYLRPDVRRGNITPEEQLLILELHSRWGNRWSKIAQYLPGRTDNEVKNYWRTRVQKHAKQLRCDVNSKQFKDMMRYQWMPRLEERIRAASAAASAAAEAAASGGSETAARRDDELSQEMAGGQENSNAVGSESESCEMQASSGSLSDCFASSVQGREDGSEAAWFLETGEFGGVGGGGWPGDGTCDGFLAAGFDPCGWDGSLWSMEDIWLMQGI